MTDDERAAALAKEVRTLRKQLERSEHFRRRAEELKEQNDHMLRNLLRELQGTQAALEQAKADLERNNRSLGEALASVQRTQEQLIQGEKMASLGLLVAGIAHEIKNPLNFVNNFAELALEFIDDHRARRAAGEAEPDDGENTLTAVVDNLALIRAHGRRADEIIDSMLMHVRDVRGESITVDLNDMLVEYTNLGYHGFRASDASFAADIVAELEPSLGPIIGPYQELARVILNLVSNACHAMRERQRRREGGYRPTLRIATRLGPDSVELVVADNGIGIAPEVRRRMFDPFFTTKPPGEGTGLGLSLSYEIVVNELRGSIDVTSSPGEGARFTVRVPLGARSDG